MFNKIKLKLTVQPGNGGIGSKAHSIGKKGIIIYHGGDGGNGGNIIFQYQNTFLINNNLKTYTLKGNDGENGKTGKKNGRHGKDIIIPLSKITQIYRPKTKQSFQITKSCPRYYIYGGKGGLGARSTKNKEFTHKNLGVKTTKEIVIIKAILPIGILVIINTNFHQQKLFMKKKFNINIEQFNDIICINKYNYNIYILPYLTQKNYYLFSSFQKITLTFIYYDTYVPSNEYIQKLNSPIYLIHIS